MAEVKPYKLSIRTTEIGHHKPVCDNCEEVNIDSSVGVVDIIQLDEQLILHYSGKGMPKKIIINKEGITISHA